MVHLLLNSKHIKAAKIEGEEKSLVIYSSCANVWISPFGWGANQYTTRKDVMLCKPHTVWPKVWFQFGFVFGQSYMNTTEWSKSCADERVLSVIASNVVPFCRLDAFRQSICNPITITWFPLEKHWNKMPIAFTSHWCWDIRRHLDAVEKDWWNMRVPKKAKIQITWTIQTRPRNENVQLYEKSSTYCVHCAHKNVRCV